MSMDNLDSDSSFDDPVILNPTKSAKDEMSVESFSNAHAELHEVNSHDNDSFDELIIKNCAETGGCEEQDSFDEAVWNIKDEDEKKLCCDWSTRQERRNNLSSDLNTANDSFDEDIVLQSTVAPVIPNEIAPSCHPSPAGNRFDENAEIQQDDDVITAGITKSKGSFCKCASACNHYLCINNASNEKAVFGALEGDGFNVTQENKVQHDAQISMSEEQTNAICHYSLQPVTAEDTVMVDLPETKGEDVAHAMFQPNISVMECDEVAVGTGDIEAFRAQLRRVLSNRAFDDEDIKVAVLTVNKNREIASILLYEGLGDILSVTHDIDYASLLSLFQFVSKVIVRCHSPGNNKPLSLICDLIELANCSCLEKARSRCCLLLQCMLHADAELKEQLQVEIVDEDLTDQNQGLSCNLLKQWGFALAERRRDKVPAVRSAAVRAISQLPFSEVPYVDGCNKEFFPSDLVFDSLRDSSVEVRQAAVQSLILRSERDILCCLEYLKKEDDSHIRKVLVEHLIRSTHVQSFTMDQRMCLLRLMLNDENSIVRLMVSQLLVPKWLENCCGVDTIEDVSSTRQFFGNYTVAFPFKLLYYIDPLLDEEAVKKMITYAISCHMGYILEKKNDVEEYLKYLLSMPAREREVLAVLHAHSLPGELKRYSVNQLHLRLFFHRCLTEHLCSFYNRPDQFESLDKILHKLLPTLHDLAEATKDFALRTLQNEELSSIAEFTIRQLCLMLRIVDKSCDVGRKSWRQMLCQIAANQEIHPSPALVDFAVREILEQVDQPTGHYQDTLVWARDTAASFLDGEVSKGNSQQESGTQVVSALITKCSVSAAVRAATIIHAVFSEGVINVFPDDYDCLFIMMTGRLFNAPSVECRSLCVRVIGLASCLDEHIMRDNLPVLRQILESDICEVKDSALTALADIIAVYGFHVIATMMFEGEVCPHSSQDEKDPPVKNKNVELLAQMFENAFESVSEKVLPSVAATCLRVMYLLTLNWPTMLGRLLMRMFKEPRNQELEETTTIFLDHYIKKGKVGGVQLVMAFLWCVSKIQFEDGTDTVSIISSMSSYVRGFIDRTWDKQNKRRRSSKDEKNATSSGNKERVICPKMLLCRGLLARITLEPWSSIARLLANILPLLHLQNTDISSLPTLHSRVVETLEMIEKEGLIRLATPLRRFAGAVENIMKRRNCKFEQKVFKKSLKHEIAEDWDPNWSVKFSPKTPKTPKTGKSIKRESRSCMATPNPLNPQLSPPTSSRRMIATVKKSLSVQLQEYNSSEVFVIDSDDSDFESANHQNTKRRKPVSSRVAVTVKRSKSSTQGHAQSRRRIAKKAKQANVVVIDIND